MRYFACCLAFFAATAVGADKWPEYRGLHGDGRADTQRAPTTWSETEHVAWKTPIRGKAWSSPVVWDSQVWVTTATPDGKELFALCLDKTTGKVLHDRKVFDIAKPQYCIEQNSYASSTPAIEAGRIYVHFGVHGTACLDTKTGTTLWQRQDLECNHHRGPASSPILYDGMLILTFDGFDVQYVVALDKNTGETLWRTDRGLNYKSDNGDIKKAYSTPSVFEIDGVQQLVSPSAQSAVAYEPKTGKELWRVECGGMNVPSRPIFGQGLLYLTTADGGLKLFAVKPEGRGDLSAQIEWKQAKGAPRYNSPILVDDLIYTCNDQGIIAAIEAKTGDVVWQKRIQEAVFHSSPVYAAGKLYFCGEDGQTVVLAPGREYNELAINKLDDGCMASPAVIEGALILRTKKALYRIE